MEADLAGRPIAPRILLTTAPAHSPLSSGDMEPYCARVAKVRVEVIGVTFEELVQAADNRAVVETAVAFLSEYVI